MAVDVLITVKNLQRQDGQSNIINYETRGYLYLKKQTFYLQYEEVGEGLEGVKSTLKLEKDRVTLIRHGKVSVTQTFEKGLHDEGSYATPYGSILMKTETQDLEVALGSEEGVVRIFYDLYLADELSSNNTLEITYQRIVDNRE